MIVNEAGIWPLEFTCRFGYPGFAVLEPLQEVGWGALLHGLATGALDRLPARSGFSVGIVLTVPPFPYTRRAACRSRSACRFSSPIRWTRKIDATSISPRSAWKKAGW